MTQVGADSARKHRHAAQEERGWHERQPEPANHSLYGPKCYKTYVCSAHDTDADATKLSDRQHNDTLLIQELPNTRDGVTAEPPDDHSCCSESIVCALRGAPLFVWAASETTGRACRTAGAGYI